MLGAFVGATVTARNGSFLRVTLVEAVVFRRLYLKAHLNQSLVTFGLILSNRQSILVIDKNLDELMKVAAHYYII